MKTSHRDELTYLALEPSLLSGYIHPFDIFYNKLYQSLLFV